jgi:hypothetical protein
LSLFIRSGGVLVTAHARLSLCWKLQSVCSSASRSDTEYAGGFSANRAVPAGAAVLFETRARAKRKYRDRRGITGTSGEPLCFSGEPSTTYPCIQSPAAPAAPLVVAMCLCQPAIPHLPRSANNSLTSRRRLLPPKLVCPRSLKGEPAAGGTIEARLSSGRSALEISRYFRCEP